MKAELENRFRYHSPVGDQAERYVKVRSLARDLAELIDGLCPESREKSLSLTHLDEVVFFANASIARNE